jgi:hypothetical protein
MTQRPTITPQTLATIISSAPERLQKKLDREPRAADGWTWELTDGQWTILAGEETILIPASTVTEVAQVKCTCLLSPRCFHVLAVLNVAEIAIVDEAPSDVGDLVATDGSQAGPETSSAPESGSPVPSQTIGLELTDSQQRAARQMFDACAAILTTGLRASGAVLQSRLLRAIHECRSEGLHRIAACGLRLMSNLRLLRDGADQFSSADAEADFREVLEACARLTRSSTNQTKLVSLEWIGIARRTYAPVTSLKLHGLFCEPILKRSGYGGVVTWLIADDGWIGSVSDVQPGDAKRIPQAWRSGVSLAGLSLSHRDLSQKCLLISKATRSIDGRLGGGESARAVTIDGQGWDAAPIALRFQTSLSDQIQRVFSFRTQSEFLKPAGTDLVFFKAIVLGYAEQDLIVQEEHGGALLRLSITMDSDDLSFRATLQMLARAPGLPLRCVGRIDLNSAGRIQLLAIAPGEASEPEEDRPKLLRPQTNQVVSIGLEEITRSQLSQAETYPVNVEQLASNTASYTSNYDESLERWLRAVAIGGRHAVPQGLVTNAVHDAARLKANLRPTAASLLLALTHSTISTTTDMKGLRFSEDPTILAEKWLAASIGSSATTGYLHLQQWMQLLDH